MTAAIDSPARFTPKIVSGIDVIDDTWGGFYRGGSYLVYGREMSGRGLLALLFSRTGARQNEKTLFVSSDRQKDLFIQAASIGFDLRTAHDEGSIRLIRVPTLAEIRYDSDDSVAAALTDLLDMVTLHEPVRLVMNDFMPFIAFRSFRRFQIEFIRFLEKMDALSSTIVLVMPEPANEQSRRVIEFMGLQMTGSVHIELAEENPRSTKRRISLIPHIGHIRHRTVDYWDLEDVVENNGGTLGAIESLEASSLESMSAVDAVVEEMDEIPSKSATPIEAPSESAPPRVETVTPEATHPEPAPSRDFTNRAAFQKNLESTFAQNEGGGKPFLLLAMKMDRGGEKTIRPFDFDFLMDLVEEAMRPEDDLLVDPESERLIVCLTDTKPEEAQHFFTRLKYKMTAETPLHADHLLHNVSAIVVPDGRPFQSAEEFMQYALNET